METNAPLDCTEAFLECGICVKDFATRRQLADHLGKVHQQQSLLSLLQPFNQCINCAPVFRGKAEAIDHLYRSHHARRCKRGNAKHAYPLRTPHKLTCPSCMVKQPGNGVNNAISNKKKQEHNNKNNQPPNANQGHAQEETEQQSTSPQNP